MNRKVLLGLSLFACVFIIAGAFLPIVDLAGFTMSWMDTEGADIFIIMGMAVLSLPAIYFGQYRALILTGLIAFGITFVNFLDFQELFGDSVSFLGWGALFAGSALLTVIGVIDFAQRFSGKSKNEQMIETTA